jgi:peptidoglycan/LPS O-acetylase OafA/YrhL
VKHKKKTLGSKTVFIQNGVLHRRSNAFAPQPEVTSYSFAKMFPENRGILDSGGWDEVSKDLQFNTRLKEPSWVWKPAAKTSLAWRVFHRLRSWLWLSVVDKQENIRRTAYLDGLRGFAAFLVYWCHHELWAHDEKTEKPIFENAFGYEKKFQWVAIPGIRTFFNGGHFAVGTFFVISGYALSTKPLSLIQDGEHEKLGGNVASALFRRWLRLYIPLICTTFLYMCSWHILGKIYIAGAHPQSNFRDEFWNWYIELKNFSFIFNQGGKPWFVYNFHAWSIPVEMKGSIVIYTAIMALSRSTKNARLWYEVALIVYFLYVADGWYCAMFLAGMLLCDLDQLAARGQLPRWIARLEPLKNFVYYHLFAMAIYLGGVPNENQDINILRKNRGWYYLSLLKPQAVFDYKWFYIFWAATFLVASTPRIPWLKHVFETRFCQYLGRISYALYLVHGPVLWTLGDRLYTAAGWNTHDAQAKLGNWLNRFPLSMAGPFGLEIAFLIPQMILLPLTLWVSEIVTRVFDEPSVRFAESLYRRTLPRTF